MGEYLILNLILFNILISQVPRERFEGKIKGTIIDKETNEPLEYASISLFREKDSTFIIGVLSDKNGEFLINVERPGIYFLRITFLGYEKREIHSLRITPENRILDIGKVYLEVSGILLKTQEVIAEPLPITYKVDKKVIEVSKMGFLSGNAVDILKNVPSVSVDIEGNVKLRGSENFLLYIDGRQSLLDPNDALKQIPASSIEKIEIITNLELNLLKVRIDFRQIQQVILNILTNAVDAIDNAGQIKIKSYREMENDMDYVVVSISDTGCGIPKDELTKIFEPFYTKKSDGTGLGLAISKQVMNQHDGKIEVESEVNRGTTFYLKFKVK